MFPLFLDNSKKCLEIGETLCLLFLDTFLCKVYMLSSVFFIYTCFFLYLYLYLHICICIGKRNIYMLYMRYLYLYLCCMFLHCQNSPHLFESSPSQIWADVTFQLTFVSITKRCFNNSFLMQYWFQLIYIHIIFFTNQYIQLESCVFCPLGKIFTGRI